MSTVREALINLRGAINRLESAARGAETLIKGQQRDMFSAPSKSAAIPAENAVIAERLDKAIRRVEELLEG